MALARLGDHARAAAEAEASLAPVNPSPLNLYNLACTFSHARHAAVSDRSLEGRKREQLAESYGVRAVELLEQALAAGYFTQPANIASFRTDPDLEAIRALGNFKVLEAKVLGVSRDLKR